MDINEGLKLISESQVVFVLNDKGDFNLIKNAGRKLEIKDIDDCLKLLMGLFKQETGLKFFDTAFEKDLNDLLIKYSKRINYENKIVS